MTAPRPWRSLLLALLAVSCYHQPPPDPGLGIDEITAHIREGTPEAAGWAIDLRDALKAAGQLPDEDHVCQVLAVLEQESGYEADPAVPNLGRVVTAEVDEQLAALGPLAPFGREALLDHVGPGQSATFAARLATVRTEREVDLLFREIVDFHEQRAPAVAKVAHLIFPRLIERHNPIETAGSMQVSVAWAQARGEEEGLDPETVRDLLYTRRGGLRYGTARLFAHEADYDAPIYRFADYNAGFYASRNAAWQAQLAEIVDLPLALDGDLTIWTARGTPSGQDGQTMRALAAWRLLWAPEHPEGRMRRDVALEKQRAFEETDTWRLVRETYQEKTGRAPAYAQLPEVALDSPKMKAGRTTRWFAERVQTRYADCLKRDD